MKKITALMTMVALVLLMTSCVSTKKIVYFKDSAATFMQAQQIRQQYEMKHKQAAQIH